MKRFIVPSLLGLVALVGLVATYPLARASTEAERSDCPGKVICPLTGEEVCKDLCRVAADAEAAVTTRADCPGQVECPLTGELVCRDQCPANVAKAADSTAVASGGEAEPSPCCRTKK